MAPRKKLPKAQETATRLVCQLCQCSPLPHHQRWYKYLENFEICQDCFDFSMDNVLHIIMSDNNFQQLTPATPVTPTATPVAAPPPVATPETAPTVGTLQIQTTTGQKQMVEVKSLGQYKVTTAQQQQLQAHINKTVKTTTL